MFEKIKAYCVTSRFLISLSGSLIILYLSDSVIYSLASFFFFTFSYIFNDLVDYEMDKENHPERPLPSGKIKTIESKILTLIIVILGLIFSYLAELFLLFFGLFLLSAFYSFYLKKVLPSIAIFLWISLVVTITLYPIKPNLFQILLVFTFFTARELLLELRDQKFDDKFSKTSSLPTLFGRKFIYFIFFFFIIAILSAVFLKNIVLIFGTISGLLFFTYYFFKGLYKKRQKELVRILLIHFILIIFI